ncbi:MAG: hypothetical protein ACK5XN_27185 [Bacteroidota bacterium]|jgi:hypothetical protein
MYTIQFGDTVAEIDGDIINLTPHDVVLVREDGTTWVISPEKVSARMIPAEQENMGYINGFPVSKSPEYIGFVGLPEPTEENARNLYIVSVIVGTAMQNTDYPLRNRLIGPDTGASAVRINGNIMGVRGFVMY